jgi:tRNA G18 (ribose-2'-O)-methylase SpoU
MTSSKKNRATTTTRREEKRKEAEEAIAGKSCLQLAFSAHRSTEISSTHDGISRLRKVLQNWEAKGTEISELKSISMLKIDA